MPDSPFVDLYAGLWARMFGLDLYARRSSPGQLSLFGDEPQDHDVSQEPRDAHGQWTAGAAAPKKSADSPQSNVEQTDNRATIPPESSTRPTTMGRAMSEQRVNWSGPVTGGFRLGWSGDNYNGLWNHQPADIAERDGTLYRLPKQTNQVFATVDGQDYFITPDGLSIGSRPTMMPEEVVRERMPSDGQSTEPDVVSPASRATLRQDEPKLAGGANAMNTVDPERIVVLDGPREPEFTALVDDMKASGWNGRPVLVVRDGQRLYAMTGSQRTQAAKQAGIQVPIMEVSLADFQRAAKEAGFKKPPHPGDKSMANADRLTILRQLSDQSPANLMAQEGLRGGKAVGDFEKPPKRHKVFTIVLPKGAKPSDKVRLQYHEPYEGSSYVDKDTAARIANGMDHDTTSERVLTLQEAADFVNAEIKAGRATTPLTVYSETAIN